MQGKEAIQVKTDYAGMTRRKFLKNGLVTGALTSIEVSSQNPRSAATTSDDRAIWVASATRVAHPVLSALGRRELKSTMPVETMHVSEEDRRKFTHLEALGRLLTGLAPWLESGPEAGKEGELRRQYVILAREAIRA